MGTLILEFLPERKEKRMLKRGKHELGVGLHEGEKFKSGNPKAENFLAVRTSVYVI